MNIKKFRKYIELAITRCEKDKEKNIYKEMLEQYEKYDIKHNKHLEILKKSRENMTEEEKDKIKQYQKEYREMKKKEKEKEKE